MRFHLLGLPHTVTNHEYVACAYTQKAYKFGQMMKGRRGITCIHYGHEDSNLPCDEHVTVTTNDDLKRAYGDYDWRKSFFKYDVKDHAYTTFYKNAAAAINERFQPGDFILPFWGSGVRPVCDAVESNKANKNVIVVEPGIGYAGGHWAKFKVWESYATMHAFGGMRKVGQCLPDWYETVIPNYFDLNQFTYRDEKQKGDYLLFIGRVFEGKGVHIAIEVAQKLGVKLKIAGQQSPGFKIPQSPLIEVVGYAGVEERKELMSRARGAFVASLYNEPFGGVQIENILSGTPTITTDWGAFAENNINGVTGYRCRTFQDFLTATKNVLDGKISSRACRQWGENFSLERIAPRYLKYFSDIHDLYTGKGWYTEYANREGIEVNSMTYPH